MPRNKRLKAEEIYCNCQVSINYRFEYGPVGTTKRRSTVELLLSDGSVFVIEIAKDADGEWIVENTTYN